MAVIPNKWVEKERKKRAHETAPSYESYSAPETISAKKPEKRFSTASRVHVVRTLRGVRR